MDLGTLFTTAFLVGLSGAAAPGPLTTMAVREASRGGFWRGWSVALGHAVPEALLVAGLAFGLGSWLSRDAVVGVLSLVGGGVLLWMGRGTLLEARHARLPGRDEPGGRPAGNAVLAGAGTTLSNPYWFLWWATIGSGYVALSQAAGGLAVVVFFLGHILADIGWLGLVAAIVASGRRLVGDGAYRGLLAVLGAFLLGFGVYFLWTGWRFLAGTG
ncbi:MAG: LysE family translocator [Limnochordales bacterium]|nr:LysE family transporter [Limnochordales bacterium]